MHRQHKYFSKLFFLRIRNTFKHFFVDSIYSLFGSRYTLNVAGKAGKENVQQSEEFESAKKSAVEWKYIFFRCVCLARCIRVVIFCAFVFSSCVFNFASNSCSPLFSVWCVLFCSISVFFRWYFHRKLIAYRNKETINTVAAAFFVLLFAEFFSGYCWWIFAPLAFSPSDYFVYLFNKSYITAQPIREHYWQQQQQQYQQRIHQPENRTNWTRQRRQKEKK